VARLRLKFVQSFGGYHYFRRRGTPLLRLPGIVGSAEFMSAYAEALAAAPAPIGKDKRSKPGSVSAALAGYYQSRNFHALTGGTPARRRAELERFRTDYGQRLIASLPKEFITALLDSMLPHAARNTLKTLRHFFAWAVERKLMRSDPTLGIRIKVPKSDGHHTWSEGDLAAFERRYPIGSKARLAFAIGLYTGLRRSDAVRIGRQHIRGDELMIPRTQKTKVPLVLPIVPELAAVIAATPSEHLTLLTTKTGKAYNANDFGEQFRKWCDDAGLPHCSFHGLRKSMLTRLADAGKTAHQIAAVSGHQTLSEVARYTKAADQRRLAREALLGEQSAENGAPQRRKA
jgi:integrase